MNTKHTPGPWVEFVKGCHFSVTGPSAAASMTAANAILDHERENIFSDGFVEIASASGKCPAIALGDTKEEAIANASLIAAAPELLEALRWYVENDEVSEIEGNEFWLAGRDRARAAIAKTTGGKQ